jgi:hypothetical protein
LLVSSFFLLLGSIFSFCDFIIKKFFSLHNTHSGTFGQLFSKIFKNFSGLFSFFSGLFSFWAEKRAAAFLRLLFDFDLISYFGDILVLS